MEEIILTVRELADLKGCTERYVRRLIEKNKMTAIEISGLATGQGGIQYRIPLSSLENRLQMKFKRRLKQLQKLEKQELPIVTEPPPMSLENLTATEREEILFWRKLLEDWQRYRSNYSGNKEMADEDFISLANVQYPAITLNRRKLYRKWKVFQSSGEAALVDKRGKHDSHCKKLFPEI